MEEVDSHPVMTMTGVAVEGVVEVGGLVGSSFLDFLPFLAS